MKLYSDVSEVVNYGVQAMQIVGAGYVIYGVGMVLSQALNGAGATQAPTWINFFCFWVVQIPVAYFLSTYVGWGPKGAILAVPVSHFLLVIAAGIVFARGTWRAIRV